MSFNQSNIVITANIRMQPIVFRDALAIFAKMQGLFVQSIVNLTSSLPGQLVKCLTTLQANTLIFFVENMREAEAFALQNLTFFQQKILAYLRY